MIKFVKDVSMLPEHLLAILACPLCKGPLTPVDSHQGLVCPACRLRFPVREGIPVMLPEEAESIGAGSPEDSE